MAKLSEKQRKFAEAYMVSGDAKAAAIKAGYSPKTAKSNGYKLLDNEAVADYIKKRQVELDKDNIANQQELQELLTGIARGEVHEEIMTQQGPAFKQASVKDRTKAAELLLKIQGAFIERHEITGPRVIEVVFEDDE